MNHIIKYCVNVIRRSVDNALVRGTARQFALFLVLNVAVVLSIFGIAHFAKFFGLPILNDNGLDSIWRIVCYFLDPGYIHEDAPHSVSDGVVATAWSVKIATPIIGFIGMVLTSGMLVTILVNTVERRVQKIKSGEMTYKDISGHIVIIGYNDITLSVIRNIFKAHSAPKKDAPTILLMSSQSTATIQSEMMAHLPTSYNEKIVIYSGNIEAKEQIARLNIDLAQEVYILGEQNDSGRDVRNLECVKMVSKYRKSAMGKDLLKVNVQVDRLPSYTLLQKLDMDREYICFKGDDGVIEDTPNIYFRPFSFYENWARLLWSHYQDKTLGYDTLDFESMRENKHVHLVIVGFNRMGRALLLEALRICHYYNYNETTGANKTKITIIDSQLDDLRLLFNIQYPHLDQIKDIDIEYIPKRVEDPEVRVLLNAMAQDESKLLTIAVCIKDPDLGISVGLNLPESIYYQANKITTKDRKTNTNIVQPRVLIRQEMLQGIGNILSKENGVMPYKNVKIFGMLDLGISDELLNDDMAIIINAQYNQTIDGKDDNDLYNAYLSNNVAEYKKLFSEFELSWAALPENMRWSNRYQVDIYNTYAKELKELKIEEYKDIGKLTQENMRPLAHMEHRRWIAERSIMGWRQVTENDVRNDNFFIHDQIIPFAELDMEQKIKDHSVVRHVLQLKEIF